MVSTNTVGARIARPFIGFGDFYGRPLAAPTNKNDVLPPTEHTDKLPQGVYTFGMQNLNDISINIQAPRLRG